jgi:ABC-type phosphate transport system permease subunit
LTFDLSPSQEDPVVIKRVSPISAAKIGGILGVLLGLLIGACVSLVMMTAGSLITASMPDERPGGAIFGMLFGAGAIVVLPIFYGVLSFIMGAIYAALYNLASKWVGGLEIEAA